MEWKVFSLLPKDLYFFMNGLEKYLANIDSGSAKTHHLYLRIHNVWGQEFFDKCTKRIARKMAVKIKLLELSFVSKC